MRCLISVVLSITGKFCLVTYGCVKLKLYHYYYNYYYIITMVIWTSKEITFVFVTLYLL